MISQGSLSHIIALWKWKCAWLSLDCVTPSFVLFFLLGVLMSGLALTYVCLFCFLLLRWFIYSPILSLIFIKMFVCLFLCCDCIVKLSLRFILCLPASCLSVCLCLLDSPLLAPPFSSSKFYVSLTSLSIKLKCSKRFHKNNNITPHAPPLSGLSVSFYPLP